MEVGWLECEGLDSEPSSADSGMGIGFCASMSVFCI
jgi:hypothetical protein